MSGDIVDKLQFRVTVTRLGGQHTAREVMSDIMAMENARNEIVRLRALITEWATALQALREVGLRYGNANWNRAYDRWDAIEKALFEEARRG